MKDSVVQSLPCTTAWLLTAGDSGSPLIHYLCQTLDPRPLTVYYLALYSVSISVDHVNLRYIIT